MVLLPDGQLLATGGTLRGGSRGGVNAATHELFNPAAPDNGTVAVPVDPEYLAQRQPVRYRAYRCRWRAVQRAAFGGARGKEAGKIY